MTDFLIDILDIILSNYQTVSVIILILMFLFDRKRLNLNTDAMAKFTGFMVLISLVRLCIMEIDPSNVRSPGMGVLRLNYFLYVGLEDVFFAMLPIYILKKVNKNIFKVIVWTIFSAIFASAHYYQGILAVFITAFYPYFISRKYILKTSLTTVMCCHFIYDCFTFLTVKLSILLRYI